MTVSTATRSSVEKSWMPPFVHPTASSQTARPGGTCRTHCRKDSRRRKRSSRSSGQIPTTDCLSFTTKEYHSLDGLANHRCQPLLGPRSCRHHHHTPRVSRDSRHRFYVVYRAAKRSTPSLEGSADLRSTLMIRTVEGLPDVYRRHDHRGKGMRYGVHQVPPAERDDAKAVQK